MFKFSALTLLSIKYVSGQSCTSNSVYVTGADDSLGFAGGVSGFPGLDGCYTLEPSLFPSTDSGDELHSSHGVFLKEGLETDGPGLWYITEGTIWSLSQMEYNYNPNTADHLAVGEKAEAISSAGSPADIPRWYDESGFTANLVVRCGCSDTSPYASPTPEPVSPTPRPVSPTPRPVSPTPSQCTSDSVYVTGADDALGFAGGISGFPELDGCYTFEPRVSVATDSGDEVHSTHGVFLKEDLYKDGPSIRYSTSGTIWRLGQWDYNFDPDTADYLTVGETAYRTSSEGSPADVPGWYHESKLTDIEITCGCGASSTPEPVSPTPRPVSPTPEPTPRPVSPTPEPTPRPVSPTPRSVSPTPEPTPESPVSPVSPTVTTSGSSSIYRTLWLTIGFVIGSTIFNF